jgi:origin recognition complex subunit 3
MCHFYANPLSLLLAFPDIDDEPMDDMLTHTHLNAIRSLPSMRRYIEEKLAAEDTIEVETLLQDDQYLKGLLRQYVSDLHERAGELKAAVRVLAKLQERSHKSKRNLVDLYLDVLTGELTPQSPFVRELLQLQRLVQSLKGQSIYFFSRKLSASSLLTFLTETADLVITTDEEIPRPFRYFAEEMEDLMANKARLSTADGALTSAYEIESRTGNRATKVSQKLRQEKDRDSMTSLDKSFTEVVARINETLIHLFRYFPQNFNLTLSLELWQHPPICHYMKHSTLIPSRLSKM